MFKQYLIKKITDNKESLGDNSAWINTALIEAEVKRSFFEKFTKKAEVVYFNVLSSSSMHNSAKDAYMSGAAWTIDTDDFKLNSILGRNIYMANEIIKEKNRQEENRRKEREAKKKAISESNSKPQNIQDNQGNQEMKLHRYFNAIEDLMVFNFKNSDLSLRPYDMDYIKNDISILKTMLSFDPEIKKYFPQFWGLNAEENIREYLLNTCMTTEAGIAFAYALRVNAGIIGLIKVTSPDHNKVTNNFPHWMIDYLMIPAMRNRHLMKASLRVVLKFMHSNLGIDEVYAMVEPDNKVSIHLLEINGFSVDDSKKIAPNPHNGNIPIAMKLKF